MISSIDHICRLQKIYQLNLQRQDHNSALTIILRLKYWCSKQSEVLQQKSGPEMYPYFYVQYCVQNNIGHKNDTHKVQNANYNIELKIMLINTKLKIH